jgi:hypothetical protein
MDKVKDLVSPGVQWCIQKGMALKIGETRSIAWPAKYKEATEKFSGQVKLNGLNLENYVAGQPFPVIDPNDPAIAVKIMWNYGYTPALTDDSAAKNFDADTGPIFGGTSPMGIERHFLIDSVRAIRYLGRLEVDPKPVWETKEGYQGKGSLHPIIEPYDLKGVGGLTFRYIDAAKQDDTWLYLPSLRRVRRLSTAQRSDALFGQDVDVDSFGGYAGHIAWMDWKLLGEKEVLGVVHAENYPTKWAAGGADFAPEEVWEKRKAYVIEGVSRLSQYAYGKRLLFVDKEAVVILGSDIFDRSGQLWKVWLSFGSARKQAFPGAKYTYDYEAAFVPAVVMVDTQLQHATRASLPSLKFPGEEGFYFNRGAELGTTEDFFTITHLIESGR